MGLRITRQVAKDQSGVSVEHVVQRRDAGKPVWTNENASAAISDAQPAQIRQGRRSLLLCKPCASAAGSSFSSRWRPPDVAPRGSTRRRRRLWRVTLIAADRTDLAAVPQALMRLQDRRPRPSPR